MSETYSHRNGESEPPTITDEYFWLDRDEEDDVFWREIVYIMPGFDDVMPYIQDFDGFDLRTWAVTDLQGRWWGPVTPPWEEE